MKFSINRLQFCSDELWAGGSEILNVSKCLEGGIGENDKREGELDVKFNAYRGKALLFHSFLQTRKVVEELLEFKYKY